MKRLALIAALLLASPHAAVAQTYDLVVKGGTVVDPSQSLNAVRDVGVKDGLVTAVAANIDPALATTVYDATGKIVTPGLVNIHAHFASPAWPPGLGVNVDATAAARGYTTMVSAGDAGYGNAAAFKSSTAPWKTRTYAWLNISSIGMGAGYNLQPNAELPNISVCEVCEAQDILRAHPDFYLGLKVRIGVPNPSLGIQALQRAVQAAARATAANGRPYKVMAHVGGIQNATIADVVAALRSGDAITHSWNNVDGAGTMFGSGGQCKQAVFDALAKGVVLDDGASVGAPGQAWLDPYSYGVMGKCGVSSTTISADEHNVNVLSIPQLWGLYLGMNNGSNYVPQWAPTNGPILTPLTLSDLVYRSTRAPALVIGDRAPPLLGTLQVGAPGDVTVLTEQLGTFPLSVWQPPSNSMTVNTPAQYSVVKVFKAGVAM